MPERIQRKRTRGWHMPEGAIYVGRPGMFGNPFPISKGTSTNMGITRTIWQIGTWDGPAMWFGDTREEAADLSVQAFRQWLNHPNQETLREKARLSLRGHDLACWCRVGSPCHADVLLEIANA